MVGNNGKPCANRAMNESDLLIMVGARVADRAVSQPDLITGMSLHRGLVGAQRDLLGIPEFADGRILDVDGLIRTEQNAAHAASGMARMTGRPGVCAVTSGPGATNVITGIATAFADSIPLICITGQVNSELLGSDVFQEADIMSMGISMSTGPFLPVLAM